MAMTISRPGISSTEITQFPLEERFIKIPIASYLAELYRDEEDQTNGPQIALINAINDPRFRFVCAALSRRLGKTHMANIIGQLVALVPGCEVLIMSPNYSLSEISFSLQRKLTNKFNIEIVRDSIKERILELANGSVIRMGSVGQVDSCVGRSYQFILFDEAALSDKGEDAFQVALRPTLDRPNSKAIFISTPRGKNNWFSRFYQRGFDPKFPQWVSIWADYRENSRMTEADVAEARASNTPSKFSQEYEASFSTYEGRIFNFQDHHVFDIEDYNRVDYQETFGGLDPGYKDPTAFIAVSHNEAEDVYYVVDEYEQAGVTTDKHAEELRRIIDNWGIELIFIDSAAAQFGADLAYQHDIATTKAKKQVLEGIAFVQNIIETGRLRVARHCTRTLFMLDQYMWSLSETSTREKPEHNSASHMADALRYALYTYIA